MDESYAMWKMKHIVKHNLFQITGGNLLGIFSWREIFWGRFYRGGMSFTRG